MALTLRLPLMTIGAALLSAGCASRSPDPAATHDEPFRPQLSFSPQRNWMNDPNGLVYHDGEYHMFYQYNPNRDVWGDMSWGHAVSTDLLHWTELPLALPVEKDAGGGITQMFFSGSAVVDHANTSGLGQPGKPAMVAIYTAVFPQARTVGGKPLRAGTQAQSLAYSLDRGRTWAQYAGNPVIPAPPAQYAAEYREFRDPKLFWYEPGHKWVLATVAAQQHKALFYSSRDLIHWEWTGEFGPAGATGGVWECPDLVELPVDGDPTRRKWVLIISLNQGGPAGGSGMQYFVGDFDGKTFTRDRGAAGDAPQWLDYGADFYAGVTYNDAPGGRRLLVGWMNNWLYAEKVPTAPWRSAQSLPRELGLRTVSGQVRLVQQPIGEAQGLRGPLLYGAPARSIARGAQVVPLAGAARAPLEMRMLLDPGSASRTGVRLGQDAYTEIGYDATRGVVYVDRTRSGKTDLHPQFAARHAAPVGLRDGGLPLRILVDRGSVTVFAGDGEVVLTDQVFPTPGETGISLFSEDGNAQVRDLNVWSLNSIWKEAR
ncbi:MAG: glycoside hydrolase family 32 protein [Massilia sp.]|nr:glycoside hydrolase family 32 protein [Massilia sp.]